MGVLLEKREVNDIPAGFYPLVRALFASRRKKVKNNLLTFLSSISQRNNPVPDKNLAVICADILINSSLTGNERAENLSFDVFLSLAKTIRNMRL